eukprot:955346-Alexandrium_andersonii.AAC.1
MSASLVGSEMCIRDRPCTVHTRAMEQHSLTLERRVLTPCTYSRNSRSTCAPTSLPLASRWGGNGKV